MGSLLELLKKVTSALIVAVIVAGPIAWMWWRIKMKKIKKLIPGDFDQTIKKHKELEKEVENAKKEREEETERTKQLPAVAENKRRERESIKSIINGSDRKKSGEHRELSKTESPIDVGKKRHPKQDWPSFS